MKKILLLLCVASLVPTTADASLTSWWTKDTSITGMDRWTLLVTPTAGETMLGFDIGVWDTASGPFAGSGPFVNNGTEWGTTADGNTHFLLQKSHRNTTDLLVHNSFVDDSDIEGALVVALGGIYTNGWSSTLALLQIVVPKGTYGYPTWASNGLPVGLSWADSDEGKNYPVVVVHFSGSYDKHEEPLGIWIPRAWNLGAIGLRPVRPAGVRLA